MDPIIIDMLRRGEPVTIWTIMAMKEARASCRIEGIDPQPREVEVETKEPDRD